MTAAVEAGLRSADDSAHANFARAGGRVLVTHDADFLRLASFSSDPNGIAYCAKDTRSVGQMVESLVLIFEVLTPQEMAGRVEYL